MDSNNGNIYVADTYNHVIRLINTGTGMVSTIAGAPGTPGYLNGPAYFESDPAFSAEFRGPNGIALDSNNGNIYVADTGNSAIRLINTTTGIVSTIAGNGSSGYLNGPVSSAKFYYPYGIALDSSNGNIYVADSYNGVIRLINITSALSKTILSF